MKKLFDLKKWKYKIIYSYEKFYQKKHLTQSDVFWEDWLFYYKDINISKEHNIEQFYEILQKRGTPDVPNPYPEGLSEHYLYHPQGIMVADFECILTPIKAPKTVSEDKIDELGFTLNEEEQEKKGMERFNIQTKKRNDSLTCVSLCLTSSMPFPRLINLAHKDDICFIVIESLLYGQYEKFGLSFKNGLKNALKRKLINKDVAKKIIDEKSEMKQQKLI